MQFSAKKCQSNSALASELCIPTDDAHTVLSQIGHLNSVIFFFQGLEDKVKGKCFVPPLVLTSEEDKAKENVVIKS